MTRSEYVLYILFLFALFLFFRHFDIIIEWIWFLCIHFQGLLTSLNFSYGVICKEVDGCVNAFFFFFGSGKTGFRSFNNATTAGANIGQFRSYFQHILRNVFMPVTIVCEKLILFFTCIPYYYPQRFSLNSVNLFSFVGVRDRVTHLYEQQVKLQYSKF